MTFTQSISICLQKYATFSGRASRSEYWWFILFTWILEILSTFVANAFFGVDTLAAMVADGLFSLSLLIPMLAVGARRLHDTNRSGWYQLLAIPAAGGIVMAVDVGANPLWGLTVLFWIPVVVWHASKGDPAENKHGVALN